MYNKIAKRVPFFYYLQNNVLSHHSLQSFTPTTPTQPPETEAKVKSVIRLGIDVSDEMGSFLAAMKPYSVMLVMMTMSVDTSYSEAVVLRGLCCCNSGCQCSTRWRIWTCSCPICTLLLLLLTNLPLLEVENSLLLSIS